MSQDAQQDHISKKRVLYDIPGVDAIGISRDLEFRGADGGVLIMDLYHPGRAKSDRRLPAVIVVAGFPDPGFQKVLGCRFKEMASVTSWARLIAASGMVAVTYTNREPATDLRALMQSLHQNAGTLGIDETRLGVWAASGNAPLGLSLLMLDAVERVTCAVLCYGYTLDLDGATGVADAARTFKFTNACAGKSLDDLRRDTPLFVTRSGHDDTPRLNETLDRFVFNALARNLPITATNHPDAPHAFDLFHDSETSRELIRRILGFLQCHLRDRDRR